MSVSSGDARRVARGLGLALSCTSVWLASTTHAQDSPDRSRASSGQPSTPTPALEVDRREQSQDPEFLVPIVHDLALMTTMRLTEAVLYPDPFANFEPAFLWSNLKRAYSEPPKFDSDRAAFEWDGDPWPINVIGHGLFGSELYMRARTCHHGALGALGFAAVGSSLWEYTFEATGVRPSALDLVYTPVVGFVLGEARYQAWQAAGRLKDRTWRNVLVVVFDPLGEFERALGTPC